MKAKLILENGVVFHGTSFGYQEACVGEVVFNTGMTGYEEILTDPSYYGQIVAMTYPLIGNYGINFDDLESNTPKVKGFVVREKCDASSNFRSEMELENYLKQHKIMAIEGIDTRGLTRILRSHGTMRGIITTDDLSDSIVEKKLNHFDNRLAVYQVTTKEKYEIPGTGKRIAVMDFGVKASILKQFSARDCHLTVFPASTDVDVIIESNPDLIFLSNGPGDPSDLEPIVQVIKELIKQKPVVGICLGHQLITMALGGTTEKLKFGHRGCNHPVKDIKRDRVYITSQNHGYHVNQLPDNMTVTHVSLNDGTIEGMQHQTLPVFSVQFHPEASPGPTESRYLFDQFIDLAE